MSPAALWDALWPNVVAPSAWTLAGIGASHWRAARQRKKDREEIKAHVTKVMDEAK